MGKGSTRRPSQTSEQEESLRWKLAMGQITHKEFETERKKLIKQGLWGLTGRLRYT